MWGWWWSTGGQTDVVDTRCRWQWQLTWVTRRHDTWRQCRWRPTADVSVSMSVDKLPSVDTLPPSCTTTQSFCGPVSGQLKRHYISKLAPTPTLCSHLLWRFAIQHQSTAPQSGHALLTQVGSMCSWTLPCVSSLVPSVLHLSQGFQCSPTLNRQPYEGRLPLTSWWIVKHDRLSATNVTISKLFAAFINATSLTTA